MIVSASLTLAFGTAQAQPESELAPPSDDSANFQTEVLLSGLDNPTGLALRPAQPKSGPYELFFAESGAGRVVRVVTDKLDRLDEVIVDFPRGTWGRQPEYRVGPAGLIFLSRTRLAVGAKQQQPGADTLATYLLPVDESVLSATQQDHAVGPLDEKVLENVDDLQFAAMAIIDKTCFLTSGGQDNQGWILKSAFEANRLANLQRFIGVQKKLSFGAPAGIAVIPHPRPAFLVVGLMGSRETPHDSRLAFFVPSSGALALNLPTSLHDTISLAYSPSGQLYAADFSWHDAQSGGIYRLDDARLDGQTACRAVKVATVVRPFSLAFAPDGTLFVTAFGEGENTQQGSLIKITGNL